MTLTIEGGPATAGVLPAAIGSLSVTPSTFTLSKGTTQSVSLSLNGGSLAAGEYPLTIRATGTNSDGQKVTRLVPIVLDIATAGTSTEYVDIMGFAVFRITSIDSNSVDGYAITRRLRRHERLQPASRSGGAVGALELAGRARQQTPTGGASAPTRRSGRRTRWKWNTRTRPSVDGGSSCWASCWPWWPVAPRSS